MLCLRSNHHESTNRGLAYGGFDESDLDAPGAGIFTYQTG